MRPAVRKRWRPLKLRGKRFLGDGVVASLDGAGLTEWLELSWNSVLQVEGSVGVFRYFRSPFEVPVPLC